MSKVYSPSPNNSGASSETSETQSAEDNGAARPNVNISDRSLKNWKPMNVNNDKDAEAKRPPWRSVSVSTLPKPDKSALLRAKLLDASRRMRAGKCSVSIQTDMVPTKLMREVNLGTQVDLILYKEVGILTDGSYTKRTKSSDEFVLTYSVSQLTDAVVVANASTQTLLPKVPGDDFLAAYFSSDTNSLKMDKFTEMERKLLQQIQKIRETNKTAMFQNSSATRSGTSSLSQNASDTKDVSSNSSVLNCEGEKGFASRGQSTLLKPTFSSWNFEYGEIGGERNADFMPYAITCNSSRPWGGFVPLPFAIQSQDSLYHHWNSFVRAIDVLLQEANYLVDVIEGLRANTVKSYARMDTPLNEVAPIRFHPPELPSTHWLPIIQQQENALSEAQKKFEKTKKKHEV